MNGMGGLFEIVIVLMIVLGWGFIELRSTRLDRKKAEASKEREDAMSRSSPASSTTSGGSKPTPGKTRS